MAPALGPGCERRASAQLWADSEGFPRHPSSGFGAEGHGPALGRWGSWVVAGAKWHDRIWTTKYPVNRIITMNLNRILFSLVISFGYVIITSVLSPVIIKLLYDLELYSISDLAILFPIITIVLMAGLTYLAIWLYEKTFCRERSQPSE